MSCALCGGAAPLCTWCRTRVVDRHRRAVEVDARRWAKQPLREDIPDWSDGAPRALALAAVAPLGVDDPDAREILVRAWLAVVGATYAARRNAAPVRRRRLAKPRPPRGTWLWKHEREAYQAPASATSFHVYRRRREKQWEIVTTAEGEPLALALDTTRAAFERAVAEPGAYRLTPIDAAGVVCGAPPHVVRVT